MLAVCPPNDSFPFTPAKNASTSIFSPISKLNIMGLKQFWLYFDKNGMILFGISLPSSVVEYLSVCF